MTGYHRLAMTLAAAVLSLAAASHVEAKQTAEVGFVLDTTGSMGPLIEGAKKKARQAGTVAADAPAALSDMASFINKRAKSSNEAVTGEGDLAADCTSGRKQLDAIEEKDLPLVMQALPKAQRPWPSSSSPLNVRT
jgi:hypothetical protein